MKSAVARGPLRQRPVSSMWGMLLWGCCLVSAPAGAAGWVDDWFAQHTSGGAGSFESQKRDFYTAGEFEGRWHLENDAPLTFSPPRLKVGCGGIDAFMGGMSFLNANYLVQKAERILQAAPYFAFDLALDEYCKECKAIKDFSEHMTNLLNSIQVNDCRLSKRLGYTVTEDTLGGAHKDILEEMWAEAAGGQSVGQGLQDNWDAFVQASSSGAIPDDVKPLTSDCPDVFQEVYMNGSVVKNVTDLVGLSGYGDVIRGLMGDVLVHPSADGKAYEVDVLQPCPGNDNLDPTDFLLGEADKKTVQNVCVRDSANGVVTIVAAHLNSIAAAITARAALSADDQAFVDSTQVPILKALQDAVSAGTVTQTIQMLQGPLAMEFAQRVFDDLFKASALVLRKASEVGTTQTAAKADQRKCDTTFLASAMGQIQHMAGDATRFRSMSHVAYTRTQQEMIADIARAEQLYNTHRAVLNKLHTQMQ
jgi:conjugative transfer pilus assembly protein TraH